MKGQRHISVIGLALVACLGASACGSSNGYGNPSPVAPAPQPSNAFTVDIAEINGPYSFIPSPVKIGSDQVVTWRNTDAVTHHVVFDDGSFDAGSLAPGTVSQPIAVTAGTHAYHCTIHPEMVGTISVGAAEGGSHGAK